jgi:hypothetical protein
MVVPPQLLEWLKPVGFVPLLLIELTLRLPSPVLVSVTGIVPVVPNVVAGKLSEAVESETAGGLLPVPLTAMDSGLSGALSVMVTVAVNAPVVTGVKCPLMMQLPPAATLDPQVFAKANDEAPVPVTVMLAMSRGALPVLVRVTDCDALVVPTFWGVPNDRLVADSDTAAVSEVCIIIAALMFERSTTWPSRVASSVSVTAEASGSEPAMDVLPLETAFIARMSSEIAPADKATGKLQDNMTRKIVRKQLSRQV